MIKNLLLDDIPDGSILHFYVSNNIIDVLLKDGEDWAVASFNVGDKCCIHAEMFSTYRESIVAFRKHVVLELNREEYRAFAISWDKKWNGS